MEKYFLTDELKLIDYLLRVCKFHEILQIFTKEKLEKLKEDKYCDQIIQTINLFVLIKLQKFEVAKELIKQSHYSFEEKIFSLLFLESKFYFLQVKRHFNLE